MGKGERFTLTEKRDLERKIADLEGALRAVGRIVVDQSIEPRRRADRVLGVLAMYGCEPQAAEPAAAPAAAPANEG